jgi:hypothetical protein
MLDFITPQFFDILVLVTAVIGIYFGARRLLHDLRGAPRFPETPKTPSESSTESSQDGGA